MIKGILIDPNNRSITDVEFKDPVRFEEIYEVIGCDTIEAVRLDNHTDLWLDEEGRYKKNNPAFAFVEHHDVGKTVQMHAGRAVILGRKFDPDPEVGMVSCDTDWDCLKTADLLEWSDLTAVG